MDDSYKNAVFEHEKVGFDATSIKQSLSNCLIYSVGKDTITATNRDKFFAAYTSAYGAPRYRHKQLAGTLRIAQWSHFVPAYDTWFDNVYVKNWGRANDTEVIVDHINQADIPARAAAKSMPAPSGKGRARRCGRGPSQSSAY